jgi:hypothetical protein
MSKGLPQQRSWRPYEVGTYCKRARTNRVSTPIATANMKWLLMTWCAWTGPVQTLAWPAM